MTAAVIDFAEYVERRRNEALAEQDVLCNPDDVDSCDWCGVATFVLDLRDAAHLFEALPDGVAVVGDICPLCIQHEHEAREREESVGRYNGPEHER